MDQSNLSRWSAMIVAIAVCAVIVAVVAFMAFASLRERQRIEDSRHNLEKLNHAIER
jgi:ABC-type enterobactin transport system permease subunit